MVSIAHIRQSDQQIQKVEEHLNNVKLLAETKGEKIGIKHLTGLAGLLHDLGKYSDEFKDYLQNAIENPDAPPKRGSVDHSTAGGKFLYQLFHTSENKYDIVTAEIVGNAIISHHSYLQDFLTPDLESKYLYRVNTKEIVGFEQTAEKFYQYVMNEQDFIKYVALASKELESFLTSPSSASLEENVMFLTKFIFSVLVDADRTDTRLFEEDVVETPLINHQELFQQYYDRLIYKIDSFQQEGDTNPINKLRQDMSEQCEAFSNEQSGIYTLSIPTGGGKTLASLRYALSHALKYKKKRIIYIVPYTTIIEQNAKDVREILNDDQNILEHHSNIAIEKNSDDEMDDFQVDKQRKLKLAKDNWDSPIIFTTMVQFLDVFYARGSRDIRRLHNLSESILIFDEVQKVPVNCISLFNKAVNFLKQKCHSSILLCTATQPALDFVENKLEIDKGAEIIKDIDSVVDAFKRVEIVDEASDESMDNDKLAEWVRDKSLDVNSILIILNTRQVVKQLYAKLKENSDIPVYHLSNSMCASHRKEILDKVRDKLSNGDQVICISTQLIEAGVDISFDCVIRSLSGLDSIAQAAGRCNRHGEKSLQYVYVIDHEEERLQHLKEIAKGKEITKRMLIDLKRDGNSHGGNLLSKKAMNRYFQEYYTAFSTDLDYYIKKVDKNMTDLLTTPKPVNSYARSYAKKYGEWPPIIITNSYLTAAENFKVIDNHTTSVVVPYGYGEDIIADLNSAARIEDLTALLKESQHYTVDLYDHELRALNQNNGVVSLLQGEVLALVDTVYSDEYGLDINGESELANLSF